MTHVTRIIGIRQILLCRRGEHAAALAFLTKEHEASITGNPDEVGVFTEAVSAYFEARIYELQTSIVVLDERIRALDEALSADSTSEDQGTEQP